MTGALPHVLWIGGGPGAGKTTVATRLARRYGLRWYGADTRTWQHRDRALRAGNAWARRWEAMTPRRRWEESTPEEMLRMSLHAERGPMVVDDLDDLPDSPLVIAEGTALPAGALSAGIAARSRAVWLLPTPGFQRATLAARALAPGPAALYRALGEVIGREAGEHGARIVAVDGSGGVERTVATVESLFREALAEGPRAGTPSERRNLLREANEAIVAQVRGFFARPWASGDAEVEVRDFLCECADPACEADVPLPVGIASAAPVLAPGHG